MICELKCIRRNSNKGNELSFGKSQDGVTFSYNRLTLEIWCIALDKVCS